jgi:hypothetical protein
MPSLWNRAGARLVGTVLSAALVLTTGLVTAAPANAAQAGTGAITGTLTDPDGQPIADAWVTATIADGSAESVGDSTDATGAYVINGLPAGDYRVRFEPATPGLVGEWWDDEINEMAADLVTVADGLTSTASAQASRDAAISGVVRNELDEPITGVDVQAWRFDASIEVWQPEGPPATTVDGAYTLAGLPRGTYLVSFGSGAGASIVEEYWRDAPGIFDATRIELAPGDAVGGIDPEVALAVAAGTPAIVGTPAVGSTLSIEPGDWTPGAVLTYQWLVGGVPASGGTEATFTPEAAHVGKSISVTVVGSLDGYQSSEATSDETAPVVRGTLVSPTPTIAGTPGVGFTLTAAPGVWTDGTVLTFQWFANGAAISGATSSKLALTAAHADKGIVVKVTGTLPGYASVTKTSAWTPKVASPAVPKVHGLAMIGKSLLALTGTWTTGMAFTYQWFADGVAIAGATDRTFVPKLAQAGKRIAVKVTGVKTGYAAITKTSPASLNVMQWAKPTVNGDLRVGARLTADRGAWSAGTKVSYQWLADGAPIPGATTYTLTLTSAQRDRRIMVLVTGEQAGFTTVSVQSDPSLRVATVSKPTISGTFAVGSTLTAKPNTWTAGTSFGYQWLANGAPIAGATRSTFVPTSYQRDKKISVTVTGRKSGWSTFSLTSSSTLLIAAAATPTVGGRLMAGSTLTAGTAGWTPDTTFSYQWYVNGAAASGATGATFRLGTGHVGKTVRVVVVGKKSGYQTLTRASATTGTVSSGKAAPATKDDCPSGYPIKGNQTTRHTTDWIYHVPGGNYYAVTDPEECFATETAAVAWGYRASYS